MQQLSIVDIFVMRERTNADLLMLSQRHLSIELFCLSVCLTVQPVRCLICQVSYLPVCPRAPLCSHIPLSSLSGCQGRSPSASPRLRPSVRPTVCLYSFIYLFAFIYLFRYCLIRLSLWYSASIGRAPAPEPPSVGCKVLG